MITREEIFRKFGPLLIEALALVIKDEINVLRTKIELPERTNKQIQTAISAKLESLSNYDWMNEQIGVQNGNTSKTW
jgi:hypothetical protein